MSRISSYELVQRANLCSSPPHQRSRGTHAPDRTGHTASAAHTATVSAVYAVALRRSGELPGRVNAKANCGRSGAVAEGLEEMLLATSSTCILTPYFLSYRASYDVASNINIL